MYFFYQSDSVDPSDHSFDRTSCQLYNDSGFLKRPDILPNNSTKLPIALNTANNKQLFGKVFKYFDNLTKKLGGIELSPFRVHVIRYLFGNKMGKHGDGLQKTERYGGCRMRLILNLGTLVVWCKPMWDKTVNL